MTPATATTTRPDGAKGAPAKAPERQGAPWYLRLARNLLWLPLAVLFALIVIEFVFSLFHIGEQEYMKTDPVLGFLHLDGKPVTFRQEGYSQSTINSQGFREREVGFAKSPGVCRVAVLGDSKTEAFQVAPEDTFCRALERRLNASGRAYEVLNFGMSGYSTGQEYLLYSHKVALYHPDIVVLAYHIGDNDENSTADGALATMPRPYFGVDPKGQLTVDTSVIESWQKGERARIYSAFDALRRHSHVWGVLAGAELPVTGDKTFQWMANKVGKPISALGSRLVSLLPPPRAEAPVNLSGSPALVLPSALRTPAIDASPPVVLPEPPAQWRVAPANEWQVYFGMGIAKWQVTAAIVRQLNEECRRSGAKLVVAGLPAPDNSLLYFKELRYLNDLSRSQGFTFVNVHEAFPSIKPMEKSPLYLDFHFSRQGHELVADTLFKALNDLTGSGR